VIVMFGNITIIMLALIILMGLVVVYTTRGLGSMGESMRQLGHFLLDKAPAGIIDLFDKGAGKGSRNWMVLGGLWLCVGGTLAFIETWLLYDSTALDSLSSVGWTYNAAALSATTNLVLVWGGLGMVLIGAGLAIQSRLSGSPLASEANATLVAFGWSTVIAVNIVLQIFCDVGRDEQAISYIVMGTIVGALLLNHLLTLANRVESQPIEMPSWMLIIGHTALLWALFANALGHFTDNTQLEWISGGIINGWFPLSLILAIMTYSVAKASGSPIWSRHLSVAMLLLFASITPFGVTASSSASGLWVSVAAIGITVGLFPIIAASTNTMATLKGRWDCLVDQPAAAASAAAALMLPIFAVGAYFTALDTFAGAGTLSDVHATVNRGFFYVVGGLMACAAMTQILPLMVNRELASRSKSRWAFWLILFGGLGWTLTSLMGDFASMALTDAGAEGSVGGFRLTASVFLYGWLMGAFVIMHNATETVFNGTPIGDGDAYAGAAAPAGYRLRNGSTSIRQLLSMGLGMDSEIIVGGEAAVAEEEDDAEEDVDGEVEAVEQITAPESEEFPDELVKFAEHLSETGKTVFDVFSEMDLNKDQVIDGFEFREGLAAMEIADLAPWDMEKLLSQVDLSGDGKIDLPELDILIMRIGNVGQEEE